jgi:NDP-sugar pyrophosphorylase family protein
MDVIILSAGLGSRLKPVTNYLPKPLIAVNKSPLLYRHLQLLNLIADNIFINISFHAAAILAAISNPKVQFFYEPAVRGTWPFIKEIGSDCLVSEYIFLISADIYIDEQVYLSLSKDKLTPCFYFNKNKSIENFAGLAILKKSDVLNTKVNSLAEFILEFQETYDSKYVGPCYKNIATITDWDDANQL